MAGNQRRTEIVVAGRSEGLDQFEAMARELDKIGQSSAEAAPEAAKLAAELRQMAQAQGLITQFAALKKSTGDLRQELTAARDNATRLGKELHTTQNPTKELGREFDKARKEVARLEAQLNTQQKMLNATRAAMKGAGVDISQLAAAERQLTAEMQRAQSQAKALTGQIDKLNAKKAEGPGLLGKLKAGYLAAAAAVGGMAAKVYDATIANDSLYRSFKVITGSAAGAAREMQFVKDAAGALGVPIREAGKAYAGLMAATKGTRLEGEETRKIFLSVSRAMSALGKSSADTEGALLAVQQMVSKGKVQAEELRGQLGERMPGAFKAMADSMGITTQELDKMLETGQVLAEDVLPGFADALDKAYAGADTDSMQANLTRLQNTFEVLGAQAGSSFIGPLTEFFSWVAIAINGFIQYMTAAGKTLGLFAAGVAQIDFKRPIESGKKFFNMMSEGVNEILDEAATKIREVNNQSRIFGDAGADANKKMAESLGLTVDGYNKLDEGQKKALDSQRQLRLDIDKEIAERGQQRKAQESVMNAQIAAARQSVASARLRRGEAEADEQAAEAVLKLAQLRSDQAWQQVVFDQQELTSLEAKRASIEAERQTLGSLSESKQKALADIDQTIEKLNAETAAHYEAAQAADENASAAERAADRVERAFNRLGVVSQQKQRQELAELKRAYEDVAAAVGDGVVTAEDAKQAFLAYARASVESAKGVSDATTKAQRETEIATLRAQAATLGLSDEFERLEGKADSAGRAGRRAMDSIGDGARQAADSAAQAGGEAVEQVAQSSGQATRMVLANVGSAISKLGEVSQRGLQEYAKNNRALADWMNIPLPTSGIDALNQALAENADKARKAADWAAQYGDTGQSTSNQILGFTNKVLEQKMALQKTLETLQQTDPALRQTAISFEGLQGSFNLLDESDLSGLKSEIDRVNSGLDQTRDKALSATEALSQMVTDAQDELDRATGNIEAIERRKLAEQIKRINEQVEAGGSVAEANKARAMLTQASQARVREERERQAAEKKNNQPDQTVKHEFDLPGGQKAGFTVPAGESAEVDKLFTALESLRRRSR